MDKNTIDNDDDTIGAIEITNRGVLALIGLLVGIVVFYGVIIGGLIYIIYKLIP